jgi:hypothetical protein
MNTKTELPPLTQRQQDALAEHLGEVMREDGDTSCAAMAALFDERADEAADDEPELAADFVVIAAKLRSL